MINTNTRLHDFAITFAKYMVNLKLINTDMSFENQSGAAQSHLNDSNLVRQQPTVGVLRDIKVTLVHNNIISHSNRDLNEGNND